MGTKAEAPRGVGFWQHGLYNPIGPPSSEFVGLGRSEQPRGFYAAGPGRAFDRRARGRHYRLEA